MTREEYFHAALRTDPPPHKRMETMDAWRLTHAALGMVTEWQELQEAVDAVNFLEEIGDLLWFWNLAFTQCIYDEDPTQLEAPATVSAGVPVAAPEKHLGRMIVHFADLTKKFLFYGKDVRLEMRNTLWAIEGLVERVLFLTPGYENETLATVRARNIAKLKARYPDQFCEQKATNRDLTSEREALERPPQST
jgi:hypothetical protein